MGKMIEKFWLSIGPNNEIKTYVFEAHEVMSGHYYFRNYRNQADLLCKKEHELYRNDFKPRLIIGGLTSKRVA